VSTGLVLFIVPAVAAFVAIAVLRRSRLADRLADRPNHRSLHVTPRPRIGGLGILAGALPCMAYAADASIAVIATAAAVLAIISLVDDLKGLPIQVRLPAHLVAAVVVVLLMEQSPGIVVGTLLATALVFAIVWSTNLFNFMDGADGLAGSMALVGFATYAYAAQDAGYGALAWSSVALASAAAGFLAHNFPPARVFMGDAGSVPLGFFAGALGACGIAAGAWPWWFPLVAFAPFVLDATVTVLRRLFRGERIWKAHREHFYQRLVLSGWTPRRLVIAAFAMMIACAAAALWALRQGGTLPYVIIAILAAIHGLLFLAIERRFRAAARR
jgi:UDP-GlcNAc:undecaprenyl-phosphate/decaprenyl-phosphate GlcNAc-1-phosphate transferase